MTPADDKVALVTGGSRGIGAAITTRFLNAGYTVVTAQRSPPTDARADVIRTEITDDEACVTLVNQLFTRYGRLDALINNAGIMREARIVDTPMELWDQTLAINLRAPFLLTKLALPLLTESGGCIVNIGSIEGLAANPQHAAYSVSKAGLHALTRATAVDHGSQVRCNAIAPGWIDTELNETFIEAQDDPAGFRQAIGRIHPVGRTGMPEEVAGLALFLCSQDAAFISGQTFTVDGGRTVKLPLP